MQPSSPLLLHEKANRHSHYLIFLLFLIASSAGIIFLLYRLIYVSFSDFEIVLLGIVLFIGSSLIWTLCQFSRSISLNEHDFQVNNWLLPAVSGTYADVLAYNRRLRIERSGRWNELTLYLKGRYAVLRSTDYPSFEAIAGRFAAYAPEVAYRPVMSEPERRLGRWLIVVCLLPWPLFVYWGFNIYVPKQTTPAVTIWLQDTLLTTKIQYDKAGFTENFHVKNSPWITFWVSNRQLDGNLMAWQEQLQAGQEIGLSIRKSDFDKYITHTLPLNRGDKTQTNRIELFGLRAEHGTLLSNRSPILEPTYSRPYMRLAIMLGIFLLGWTAWVGADRYVKNLNRILQEPLSVPLHF